MLMVSVFESRCSIRPNAVANAQIQLLFYLTLLRVQRLKAACRPVVLWPLPARYMRLGNAR